MMSQSAEHMAPGRAGPPGPGEAVAVQAVMIHTELEEPPHFKIIYPCRRHERP